TEILPPHDHQMRAVLGVYRGRERNILYRRVNDRTFPAGELTLSAGQFHVFGPDDIHAVQALDGAVSLGLHIYLGPLSKAKRSLFDWVSGDPLPMSEAAFLDMKRAV
ncbi:MAG: hypothetical protein AAF982_11670, partial [Pseudomonadota bacterium]